MAIHKIRVRMKDGSIVKMELSDIPEETYTSQTAIQFVYDEVPEAISVICLVNTTPRKESQEMAA